MMWFAIGFGAGVLASVGALIVAALWFDARS